MVFTEDDVKQLLQESLTLAQAEPDKGNSAQEINRNKSQSWVKALAEQFRSRYQGDPSIHVFSQDSYSNRRDFGLNELLHDIVVCRVGEVASAKHRKTLYFIKETIWQVESELARNSRQALIDFSKLVLGSAHNKLFVGPQVSKVKPFLDVLKPAARACRGSVYISLIPHPDNWKSGEGSVKLWLYKQD